MKLGIMQPYLFPYVGYFDLINRTDKWVVFDVVKYVPKSWMNRNRILHPTTGWQYFSVPVDKRTEGGNIKDVICIDKLAAHRRVRGQLEHYRHGRAPYFVEACKLIDSCFESTRSSKLCELNVSSLELTCKYLGIGFEPLTLSEMSLDLPRIESPGQWALEISASLGASEYINPPNGRSLFEPEAFANRNIKLSFTELSTFRYPTKGYSFIDHLSIIDVIMWNSPGDIKSYLDSAGTVGSAQRYNHA